MRCLVMIAVVTALTLRAMAGGVHSAEGVEREDPAAALKSAAAALAKNPNDDRALVVRARAHESQRDFAAAAADFGRVIELVPTATHLYANVGQDEFRAGRIAASLAAFDKLVAADPRVEPYLWQRGIALYYAGEYERGAKQFELHRTVNPADVENAAWHFLCVARWKGVAAAREQLIPISGDERVPMTQAYALFAGKGTAAAVFAAADGAAASGAERKRQLMYANLYVGLYEEAVGHSDAARAYVAKAAGEDLGEDYMSDVARVHVKLLEKGASTGPAKK